MKVARGILAFVAIFVWLVSRGSAQNILLGTVEPALDGGSILRAIFDGPPRSLAPAVTGAPYSGELVTHHTRTNADGSRIIEDMPSHWLFRDAQGRRRMESSTLTGPKGEPGIDLIEIRDFVTGYEYTLDTANYVAHRLHMPPDVQHARTQTPR